MAVISVNPFQGERQNLQNSEVFIKELWSGEILHRRDASLIMSNAVMNDQFLALNRGDKVHIPIITDSEVRYIIPNVPFVTQANNETEFEMSVFRQPYVSRSFADILATQVDYNLRSQYTQRDGYALARDINLTILGMRACVPTVQHIFCSSTGAWNGTPEPISLDILLEVNKRFMSQSIPQSEIKAYGGPSAYVQLNKIEQFINADYTTRRPMMDGGFQPLAIGHDIMITPFITENSVTGIKKTVQSPTFVPSPGVEGSPWMPNQNFIINASDAPASHTAPWSTEGLPQNNGAGVPYTTMMFCAPQWARMCIQRGMSTESGRELRYLSDVYITHHIFDVKAVPLFEDHIILVHHAVS